MTIGVPVLTVTAILFLPPAAATPQQCPTGWTPSPANAAWGLRCYLVPPERSTSLFRCVDLCGEHGGIPACIGSAEENDYVTTQLAAADGLWLGLYENEPGPHGPSKGWNRCAGVEAPSFTNWYEGRPDEFAYQEDCAFLNARTGGKWDDLECGRSVYYELSCLCARGNASPAFTDDLKALEATQADNQRLLMLRTVFAFAVAVAVAILPTLLLNGRAGWRWLHRRRSMDTESWGQGRRNLAPMSSAPAAALSTPSGAASSGAIKRELYASLKLAAGRRLHISFVMGQMGWSLCVIGLAPFVSLATGRSIEAAVGSYCWWCVLTPPGICLLLLALFPTDARAIRVVCATLIVVCAGFGGALVIDATLAGVLPGLVGYPCAALYFTAAGALAPTLRYRGYRAMQPRPALRRLWVVIRLFFLGFSVPFATVSATHYIQGSGTFNRLAAAALSVTSLLFAALATPRSRGRIHRRLGRLGGRGTEEEEAAAVASLIGGSDPDAALDRASKLLRCLPASRLHAADLADNMTSAASAKTLRARTEPAAMGEVTAFLSHSWSDEREAPGAKHAVVSHWAKRRQEITGKDPTLWLVWHSPPIAAHAPSRSCMMFRYEHALHNVSVSRMPHALPAAPQDKACIDQNNIQQSLACLPVFLAGCQTLLVVAGTTYCSRLWCVMELFTFARSERLAILEP